MEVGGRWVSRLDDVDGLTYHALSMSIDQFHTRFIRYVDLGLLLRQRDGIVLAATERAREWQTARALYSALRLGCRLSPELRTAGRRVCGYLPRPASRRRMGDDDAIIDRRIAEIFLDLPCPR